MKKTSLIVLALALMLLAAPLSAKAFQVKARGVINVPAEETVNGNLYAAGNTITVDGTITGDLICGAQSLTVNGAVEGDIICAAQNININGEIGGSIRAAGNSVSINSAVARNVQIFGATLNLGNDSNIGWDCLIAGAVADIKGSIGRDLHGSAAQLNLDGEVKGDVRVKIDSGLPRKKSNGRDNPLTVSDNAVVGGSLNYSAGQEAFISTAASVAGGINYSPIEVQDRFGKNFSAWFFDWLFAVFSSFVIGLILVSVWRKPIIGLSDLLAKNFRQSLGWGAVITLLTPIICALLLFTIIGIPLSLMMLALWIILLFLSKIFSAIALGRYITAKYIKSKKDSLIHAMVIGVLAAWLLFSLPLAGWIFTLLAVFLGAGAFWLKLKKA